MFLRVWFFVRVFFSVTYLLSVICYLGIGIRRSGRRVGEGDDKKLNCDREEGTHQSFRRVKTLDTPWRKPTARDYPYLGTLRHESPSLVVHPTRMQR